MLQKLKCDVAPSLSKCCSRCCWEAGPRTGAEVSGSPVSVSRTERSSSPAADLGMEGAVLSVRTPVFAFCCSSEASLTGGRSLRPETGATRGSCGGEGAEFPMAKDLVARRRPNEL
jgi:hypothetical protein